MKNKWVIVICYDDFEGIVTYEGTSEEAQIFQEEIKELGRSSNLLSLEDWFKRNL